MATFLGVTAAVLGALAVATVGAVIGLLVQSNRRGPLR